MTERKDPAWFTSMVDQRLAMIEESVGSTLPKGMAMVMSPLTEPDEGATPQQYARWDRSCDCCRTYCPPGKDFYTGHVMRQLRNGTTVCLTFGVCKRHRW